MSWQEKSPDPPPPDRSDGSSIHDSPRTRACDRGQIRIRTGRAMRPCADGLSSASSPQVSLSDQSGTRPALIGTRHTR